MKTTIYVLDHIDYDNRGGSGIPFGTLEAAREAAAVYFGKDRRIDLRWEQYEYGWSGYGGDECFDIGVHEVELP